MLRCSDLLALKVGDLTGKSLNPKAKLVFRQKKTGKGVDVELSPYTRNVLSTWIERTSRSSEDYLFTRRGEVRAERALILTSGFHFRGSASRYRYSPPEAPAAPTASEHHQSRRRKTAIPPHKCGFPFSVSSSTGGRAIALV